MGRKSLEKTIEKRLNKESNIKTKPVNETIKKKRQEEGYSLSNVSEGICCPSYLYKFESGEVEPNADIVEMICEKFDVEYISLDKAIELNNKIIERFNKAFYDKDGKELEKIKKLLYEEVDKYLSLDVKIALLKCVVMDNNRELTHDLLGELKLLEDQMNNKQFINYTHANAMVYISEFKLEKAIKVLLELCKLHVINGEVYLQKIINYQLAWCYVQIGNYNEGYRIADKCYKEFLEDYNFNRAMESKLLLLISHSETCDIERTILSYENFINSCRRVNFNDLVDKAKVNLCIMLHYRRKYYLAMTYCKKNTDAVNILESIYLKLIFIINAIEHVNDCKGKISQFEVYRLKIIKQCNIYLDEINDNENILTVELKFWKQYAELMLLSNSVTLRKLITSNLHKVFKPDKSKRELKYLYFSLSKLLISESRYKDAIRYHYRIFDEIMF